MTSELKFCNSRHHEKRQIHYMCLQQSCKGQRLICRQCSKESHRKHLMAVLDSSAEPISRLSQNNGYKNKNQAINLFNNAISSITNKWEKIVNVLNFQTKKMEINVIGQLETLSHTFTDDYADQVFNKMIYGEANSEQIQNYVRIINLLGRNQWKDAEKVLSTLQVLRVQVEQTIEETTKKVESVINQFQNKINLLSYFSTIQNIPSNNKIVSNNNNVNPEVSHIPTIQTSLHQYMQIPKQSLVQSNQPVQPQIYQQSKKSRNKRQNIKEIPQQQIITQAHQKQTNTEETVKTQQDTTQVVNQITIGLQYPDIISSMKKQMRLKIKRCVVKCCKNPQIQLTKILTLSNLQELQIFWYQLARKQFIIKLINNLPNLRTFILNCANQFDQQCCKIVPKKINKVRRLQYGWDFLNSLRQYDQGIYFRLSRYTNRGCPLKTSVTRQMVVGLKRLQNVWLGDFMYFRPSNNQIPFRNIKQFTLGQTKGRCYRIPQKLRQQLIDMKQLLSLAILHVKIQERKLAPILMNNPFIRTFIVEGCDDISDVSLNTIANTCSLTNLSIRQSKNIEGAPIWNMKNLTTLILVQCPKIKSYQAAIGFKKMNYLHHINIYGNQWVTNDLVKNISNPSNIISLNLGRTAITDEALFYISKMVNLRTLCLDCNIISGKAILELSTCLSKLQKLSLWGIDGDLNGADLNLNFQILAKNLPNLKHFSIRLYKKIDSNIFLNFKSLRYLQTDHTNLTPYIEEELQKRGVKLICDLDTEIVDEIQ